MAKYLWKVNYNADGVRGILKEGAANRRSFIEKLTSDMGGTVEAFYFAFGETDAFVVADMPDDTTIAAVSLAVAASGAATVETVKLLTPEQIDEAREISVAYRAPGA